MNDPCEECIVRPVCNTPCNYIKEYIKDEPNSCSGPCELCHCSILGRVTILFNNIGICGCKEDSIWVFTKGNRIRKTFIERGYK